MDKETVTVYNVDVRDLKPYIPMLKRYFGFPFFELELEIALAERETNPDGVHKYRIVEHVSEETILYLLNYYFDLPQKSSLISSFLWLVANLYYSGNVAAHDDAAEETYIDPAEVYEDKKRIKIREEIAQLYSFIQKQKTLPFIDDKEYHGGKPIEFVLKDKTSLKIHNTSCWFEAFLENYLFPNCLPDVLTDEDAQIIWDKGKQQPGPKAQKEKNVIIHGVEMFLHDQGVVTNAEAPSNLCVFLYYYLIAMGLLEKQQDGKKEDKIIWGIKSSIHNFRKKEDNARYFYAESENVSLDEPIIPPEDVTYDWLFNPKQDKEDEEKKEDVKEEIVEKKSKRSLLSKARDIFRIGVYKKEKKEDTSHS